MSKHFPVRTLSFLFTTLTFLFLSHPVFAQSHWNFTNEKSVENSITSPTFITLYSASSIVVSHTMAKYLWIRIWENPNSVQEKYELLLALSITISDEEFFQQICPVSKRFLGAILADSMFRGAMGVLLFGFEILDTPSSKEQSLQTPHKPMISNHSKTRRFHGPRPGAKVYGARYLCKSSRSCLRKSMTTNGQ